MISISYRYSWNLNLLLGNKSLKEKLEELSQFKGEVNPIQQKDIYELTKDIRLYNKLSKMIGNHIKSCEQEIHWFKGKLQKKDYFKAYNQLVNKMKFHFLVNDRILSVNKSYLEHLLSSTPNNNERQLAYNALYKPYINNQDVIDQLLKSMINENKSHNPLHYEISFLIKCVPNNIVYEKYLNIRFGNEINLFDKAFNNDNLNLLHINEAVAIIINCFRETLDISFERIIVNALVEGRFDLLPKEGKYPGAFCLNLKNKGVFLLCNFYGDIDSLFTLMHEIGHYISFQKIENKELLTVVSETHAIVCELILIKYLISKNKSSNTYKLYLKYYLELYDEYIFSQLLLADFELNIYENNTENFSLLFENLLEKYYKAKIKNTNSEKFGYLRIPQLFKKFYTSTYPIAFLIAQYIVENIIQDNIDKYLFVLSTSHNYNNLNQFLNALEISINQQLLDFTFKELDLILNEYKKYI